MGANVISEIAKVLDAALMEEYRALARYANDDGSFVLVVQAAALRPRAWRSSSRSSAIL
jgi:hypothetical protein